MDNLNDRIRERVINVVAHCAGCTPEQLPPDCWDLPLTGRRFDMTATDLVYVLFELEREFGITIPPEYLENYGLSSIQRICATIRRLSDV